MAYFLHAEDLISKGVDPSHLSKRGELLKAGYVFSNVVGNGEKLIIDGKIGGIDFSKLRLLTFRHICISIYMEAFTLEGKNLYKSCIRAKKNPPQ